MLIFQKTCSICCNARHFNYILQENQHFILLTGNFFQKTKKSLYLFVVYVQYYRFFQANKNTINLSLIFSAGKRGSFIKIFLAVVPYRSVSSEQLTMSCYVRNIFIANLSDYLSKTSVLSALMP